MDKTVTQIGQFIGPRHLLDWLNSGAADLRRIKSWQDGVSPKSSASIIASARGAGIMLEAVFDAAHGRRFLCFAYQTREDRAACWQFHAPH